MAHRRVEKFTEAIKLVQEKMFIGGTLLEPPTEKPLNGVAGAICS